MVQVDEIHILANTMDSAQNLVDVSVACKIVLDDLAENWSIVLRLGDPISARQIESAGREIFGKDVWAAASLDK